MPSILFPTTLQFLNMTKDVWTQKPFPGTEQKKTKLTKPITRIIINRAKLPSMAPINTQSGMTTISLAIAMPFWITFLGVVGKNGPFSAQSAPLAMTRTNCNTKFQVLYFHFRLCVNQSNQPFCLTTKNINSLVRLCVSVQTTQR